MDNKVLEVLRAEGRPEKFSRPLRCLITQPLRDLNTWSVVDADKANHDEPKHPHTDFHVAQLLRQSGAQVLFSNQVGWKRIRDICKKVLGSKTPEVVSLLPARNFDVILAYSTMGAAMTELLHALPRRRPAIVLFMLANPNPNGSRRRVALRRFLVERAVSKADAVVCGLNELAEAFVRRKTCGSERMFYAPTGIDTDFYDPARVESSDWVEPSTISRRSFVLSVGDSSRDDQSMYHSVRDSPVPVIRVTRDQAVVSRVQPLMNKQRGDLILTGISFRQLRWLYVHCSVFIMASRLDDWQAAGSTALTEAMACGALCICTGGGCLEREWRHLAMEANTNCPVQFYQPLDVEGLHTVFHKTINLTSTAKRELSSNAREMALRAFPVARAYRAIIDAVAQASS
jgi:glycosyltransferase involved in cell wall biosynthesis